MANLAEPQSIPVITPTNAAAHGKFPLLAKLAALRDQSIAVPRQVVVRCLPVALPVFIYPYYGTLIDVTTVSLVGCLLGCMLMVDRWLEMPSTAVVLTISMLVSLILFAINPAAGLTLALILMLEYGRNLLPAFFDRCKLIWPILSTVLIVDLGAITLGAERSFGLMAMSALLAAFARMQSGTPDTDDKPTAHAMLPAAILALGSIAGYLYLVTSDPQIIQAIGETGLFTVPFVMAAVLRVFHLRFVLGQASAQGWQVLRDDSVLMSVLGWCLSMSLIEFLVPTL